MYRWSLDTAGPFEPTSRGHTRVYRLLALHAIRPHIHDLCQRFIMELRLPDIWPPQWGSCMVLQFSCYLDILRMQLKLRELMLLVQ
ncbi:hypothetical protein CEUSTIGMA_g12967.t1 [Chlamydomonas eustigma]|uniref:Uncharacterized protein n=1 Tax=Chlamydomonas eustigma TaxID=1157962 RepID=A0A250XRJ1_9CHLO|nr:hypothetical protein CEUSTIGMA_g12967.t1 [Chlamydomonas eustigma]|eukprot:GAX85552.1 hypothetical protein CEUSTIGMA_g12967.t1 [Chlamydomonas eustigma]